jgi:hypothetical protein
LLLTSKAEGSNNKSTRFLWSPRRNGKYCDIKRVADDQKSLVSRSQRQNSRSSRPVDVELGEVAVKEKENVDCELSSRLLTEKRRAGEGSEM